MYDSWRDDLYAGVPRSGWLASYAERFAGVEINATHYRLQARSTFERWRAAVPAGFVFAVKANRYLTHVRLLHEPLEPIRTERDRAAGLGPALGAVLWQLPARLARDDTRLEGFLETLEREWPTRHAVEFRHRGWFVTDVAARLRAHGVANCISHAGAWPMWEAVTADLVYVRLHGSPRTYVSEYGETGLRPWVERAERWLGQGLDVQVWFDDDEGGAAPRDAALFLRLIGHAPEAPGQAGRPTATM
jgi:uncharacterized protein YecE (DUF72 family)